MRRKNIEQSLIREPATLRQSTIRDGYLTLISFEHRSFYSANLLDKITDLVIPANDCAESRVKNLPGYRLAASLCPV
jgi:hypothetical protein